MCQKVNEMNEIVSFIIRIVVEFAALIKYVQMCCDRITIIGLINLIIKSCRGNE